MRSLDIVDSDDVSLSADTYIYSDAARCAKVLLGVREIDGESGVIQLLSPDLRKLAGWALAAADEIDGEANTP